MLGDAQQEQRCRGRPAGAVLARRAMEQCRSVLRLGDLGEEIVVGLQCARQADDLSVRLLEQCHRLAVTQHLLGERRIGEHFEDLRHVQLGEPVEVIAREVIELDRLIQLAGSNVSAVRGRVSPDVAHLGDGRDINSFAGLGRGCWYQVTRSVVAAWYVDHGAADGRGLHPTGIDRRRRHVYRASRSDPGAGRAGLDHPARVRYDGGLGRGLC